MHTYLAQMREELRGSAVLPPGHNRRASETAISVPLAIPPLSSIRAGSTHF